MEKVTGYTRWEFEQCGLSWWALPLRGGTFFIKVSTNYLCQHALKHLNMQSSQMFEHINSTLYKMLLHFKLHIAKLCTCNKMHSRTWLMSGQKVSLLRQHTASVVSKTCKCLKVIILILQQNKTDQKV